MTERQVAEISGCVQWSPILSSDSRGTFSKVLFDSVRSSKDYSMEIQEIFWTNSKYGVIRGMHLQLPPNEGSKLVWVTSGVIRDVILDLRPSSPTFQRYCTLELNATTGLLHIPIGCAHGYEVLSSEAVVNYAQDCDHVPASDSGVRWNSFGCDWITAKPIVSQRDAALPMLHEFVSPFI